VDVGEVLKTRELELAEHKSGKRKKYSLEAVLLHAGASLNRGHYISRMFGGNSNRIWKTADDAKCGTVVELTDSLRPFVPYLLFFREKK
jgi:ubiquitin C-terminal hydrolase